MAPAIAQPGPGVSDNRIALSVTAVSGMPIIAAVNGPRTASTDHSAIDRGGRP